MKGLLYAVIIVWALGPGGAWAEQILFAPLPMENRETVIKQFSPLVTYLARKTGCEIVFEYCDNYSELLEKFQEGRIDLAYLGPLPYVSLKAGTPQAIPLVFFNESSGEPLYTCSIVAVGDKNVSLDNATGRKVALTQPLSTCGYLSTNGLLRERDLALADNFYRYLDKHDEVALAVVRGDYDFGGLKTSIGRKYFHLGLMVLAETGPMPSFALIGNSRKLSAERLNAIRDALVELDPAGKDKALLSDWGENIRYGAVPASDQGYEVIRKLLGDDTIPEKGNF